MELSDTIVALSSASGPGVRAIVRLSGPQSLAIATANYQGTAPAPRTLAFGEIAISGVHSRLPADILFFPGPRSYTGQDLIEIHTLGSPSLVERLIADCLNARARAAGPGEFTMRSFLAGKKDLPQAEAVLAVIEATDEAELKPALEQLAGGVTQTLAALRDDLLNLLADVEAALDFTEEDIEFVTNDATIRRIAAGMAHLLNLQRQLEGRAVTRRTMRVALVGEPNAGKSSLFNALVGTPAVLVSPIAGTTRDYVNRTIEIDGVPLELIDTAGWQIAADTIEAQSQELGRSQAISADLVLVCVPVGDRPPAFLPPRSLLVRTKSDLGFTEGLCTSTVTENGIDGLQKELHRRATAFARPALAPSLSRCRGHLDAALIDLRAAHAHAVFADPPELLALALRQSLAEIGALAGTVYTDDLLDRIFSRFCIGK